jgi:hypothetical protein
MNIKFQYRDSKNQNEFLVQMEDWKASVNISQERIEQMIEEGIKYLLHKKSYGQEVSSWNSWTGDTLVLLVWEDDNIISITVATPRQIGEIYFTPRQIGENYFPESKEEN